MITTPKPKTHYVDNKKLYEELVVFKKQVKAAIKDELPRPAIPNYIGECLLLIANRLSTSSKFVNYTYRDEMVSDGIENCILYLDNFDPVKYNNPFAYFTQIIYFAFIRRITKEKKQTYIKQKVMEKMVVFDEIGELQVDLENAKMHDVVEIFEGNKKKKKEKKDAKQKEQRKLAASSNRRLGKKVE